MSAPSQPQRAPRAALRGAPSPVPERPARLPGELWGLAAFFNPAGYESKARNFHRFCRGVRRQGLQLLTVELAFGDAPFELDDGVCDRVLRRRSDTVLWHKERLLNVGLEHLPRDCDKVVWVDADVVFENDDWVEEARRGLERYVALQPYEQACWLPRGVEWAPPEAFSHGQGEGRALPGMALTLSHLRHAAERRRALASFFEHGHTGFAWAVRRAAVAADGLYDGHILGSGDFVMAHAMYGNRDLWRGHHWYCRGLGAAQVRHLGAWSRRFYEKVQGSVSYVPGRVLHLWHGSSDHRLYQERLRILEEGAFDPATDIAVDATGVWCWTSAKPKLHRRVQEYFLARREDA